MITQTQKAFFTLNAEAIYDLECRVIFLSLQRAGSTHDTTAFVLDDFPEKWAGQTGTHKWWMAADEAREASENIITSWLGRNVGLFKDSFDLSLSGRNRNVIKGAFALLVNR